MKSGLISLVLKQYNPLAKNGVTYVELNTNDIFNILLGRNGFGKTSLLREMTPEPPDNADYGDGGEKKWIYKDKRGTFQLLSQTGKNSSHEFIFNGKNLNEGKTLLVQKELVRNFFGFNSNSKNVLTGLNVKDLFTVLSPARRKEFLMANNPNDTRYALKVFDKLKSNYSTIRGGLKIQRQNLVVEEGRMNQLASMNVESLEKEITLMDGQLKEALVLHGVLSQYEFESIKPLKEQVDQIISKLLSYQPHIKMSRYQYLRLITKVETQIACKKEFVTKLSAVLSEVTAQLQGLDKSTSNIDGYELRLNQINNSIVLHTGELQQTQDYLSHQELFSEGNQELDDLVLRHGHEIIEQLQQVVRTSDSEITSAIFIASREKLVGLKNEFGNLENEITQQRHQIDHFNKAGSVDCPECKTQFKPGFEKLDINKLKHELGDLSKRSVTLQEEIRKWESYIEVNEDWFMSMDALMRFVRRAGTPPVLLNLIKVYGVGRRDTGVLVENIRRTLRYKDSERQLNQLNEEQITLQAQIKFLKSSDVNALFLRAEEVERELAFAQRSVINYTKNLEELESALATIEMDNQLRTQLTFLVDKIKDQLETNGKFKIKQQVEVIINDISPKKDQMVSSLIRAQSLHSVIDSIKRNIAELEKKEKHTLLLMEGLSPVKGLIGHLMNDFLTSVIANMNALIGKIWTKRLIILGCETGKGEDGTVDLSYKFPVISGDTDKTNKDISECSGGEQEIINFAFRSTMLRYLGEESGLPLMMDEVGVAFDELHRKNFCVWIEEQYRLNELPQTFLISHYVQQFGNFQDVNVIALNTEGLNIPVTVNKKSVLR